MRVVVRCSVLDGAGNSARAMTAVDVQRPAEKQAATRSRQRPTASRTEAGSDQKQAATNSAPEQQNTQRRPTSPKLFLQKFIIWYCVVISCDTVIIFRTVLSHVGKSADKMAEKSTLESGAEEVN